jgi:hypothetical protein
MLLAAGRSMFLSDMPRPLREQGHATRTANRAAHFESRSDEQPLTFLLTWEEGGGILGVIN